MPDALAQLKTHHLQLVEADPFRVEIFLLGGDLSLDESMEKLDSFLDRVEVFWTVFLKRLEPEDIIENLGLSMTYQVWEVDLNLVSDKTMTLLNQNYRQKNESTDVLSFPQVADSSIQEQIVQLPSVQLGSLFISLDWAKVHQIEVSEVDKDNALTYYLMERFIHGLLHLMGAHHDSMADYERVVAIQKDVLAVVFGLNEERFDESKIPSEDALL